MTEHVISHLVALIARRLMPRYSDENICMQHAWWMLHAITTQNKASLIAQHTIALTKMDGTGKGGIIFGIAQELAIPIIYICHGEKIDDLKPFNSIEYVDDLIA